MACRADLTERVYEYAAALFAERRLPVASTPARVGARRPALLRRRPDAAAVAALQALATPLKH